MTIDPTAWRHIDAAVNRLLESLGDDIARDAERYAPRDTGLLASRIHALPVRDRMVRVVADTDYAAYVELGTRSVHAQPYLRPALHQRRGT